MSKRHLLALFTDFDAAEKVVTELRNLGIQGFNADKDLIVKSPIEHPEVEKFLGRKPVRVQWFTLVGAVGTGFMMFWLVAAGQGSFFAQMKGGKAIVPFPPNFVLTYEFFILGGVYITVMGFLICAGLPSRRSPLYSAKVSEDQIGILVNFEESASATLKSIFVKHQALEIQEEAGK